MKTLTQITADIDTIINGIFATTADQLGALCAAVIEDLELMQTRAPDTLETDLAGAILQVRAAEVSFKAGTAHDRNAAAIHLRAAKVNIEMAVRNFSMSKSQ